MALTAQRAFGLNARSAPPLPQPEELAPLWEWGATPRKGELIMVAGRSGSQKSGFALFWTRMMNLPTLYISGDMTAFEATSRLVQMELGETMAEVEAGLGGPDTGRYRAALDNINLSFSFGHPITWSGIDAELTAWVELNNSYPEVIVIDNLMDIEGCESDYTAQMEAMQLLTALARDTESTVIVLHHATDKSARAETQPGYPPSRKEIKGGHSEKPQMVLGVAYHQDSGELRVAVLKQRSGKSDPDANDFIRLRAYPEYNRFEPLPRHRF